MVTSLLPPRKGISAPAVTNIPAQWDPAWFRYFITNFMSNMDTRNANTQPSVVISGNIDSPALVQTTVSNFIAFKTKASSFSTNILTADPDLILDLPVGTFLFDLFFPVTEIAGTAGFQFDLGASTLTSTSLVYAVEGFADGITIKTTATQVLSTSISAVAPTWIISKGFIVIGVAGTLAVRWAQSSNVPADPTTLQQGAYLQANKIG